MVGKDNDRSTCLLPQREAKGMWTSEWPERPMMEMGKEGLDDRLSSTAMERSLHLPAKVRAVARTLKG